MFWGARVRLRVLISLTAALFLTTIAFAGPSLTGTLRDTTGNPLSGVSITLRALPGGQEITNSTNAEGQFAFRNLAAGAYALTVTANRSFQLSKPLSISDATPSLNLQLPPSGDQIIVVETSASSTAQSSGGEHLSSTEVSA